jgi:hypothetical protein
MFCSKIWLMEVLVKVCALGNFGCHCFFNVTGKQGKQGKSDVSVSLRILALKGDMSGSPGLNVHELAACKSSVLEFLSRNAENISVRQCSGWVVESVSTTTIIFLISGLKCKLHVVFMLILLNSLLHFLLHSRFFALDNARSRVRG